MNTSVHTSPWAKLPIWQKQLASRHSFISNCMNSCGLCPKLIFLAFSLIDLFLQTYYRIGGPAPNRLADALLSVPLDTSWQIWQSWLSPISQLYIHQAQLVAVPQASGSFEDTKEKMKSLPSSLSLPRRLGDIFTPACVTLQTFPDAFRELNPTANDRAQWCPAMLLPAGISRKLQANFPRSYFAAFTSSLFQAHINTTVATHTETCGDPSTFIKLTHICEEKNPHFLGVFMIYGAAWMWNCVYGILVI